MGLVALEFVQYTAWLQFIRARVGDSDVEKGQDIEDQERRGMQVGINKPHTDTYLVS